MPKSHSTQPEIIRQLTDGDDTLTVTLTRDKRLRSSARWTLHHSVIQVRVPARLARAQVDTLLEEIVAKVLKQRRRARSQNDADLETRARALNRDYFDSELDWHTIRWVSNMTTRLGSCSTGGTTDGDIRISDRLRVWPSYVLDYVIAHELAHRKYPNHSRSFWEYLSQYPLTERARGFIEGIAYAENVSPDDLI